MINLYLGHNANERTCNLKMKARPRSPCTTMFVLESIGNIWNINLALCIITWC